MLARRLGPDEGPVLKEIRLRAIQDAPTGHSVSLDETRSLDDAHWESRAVAAQTDVRRVWVVEREDGLVGIVGADVLDAAVIVDALWVAPERRGLLHDGRVAEALLHAVSCWALEMNTRVSLWVHEDNARARRFYERCGFAPTGRSKPYRLDPSRTDFEMLEQAAEGRSSPAPTSY